MTADRLAALTGARQLGLLTLGQARAAGLNDRQVRSRIVAGRLTGPAHGLPLRGDPSDLGGGGARCGARHGLPRGGVPRHGGVLVHRTAVLDSADLRTVRGVPCTSAARTVIDLAARLDADPLRQLVDDVVFDELAGRAALHRRAEALARGRGGVDVVLGLTRPGAEEAFRSWLEREAARVLAEAAVPAPRWNLPVADRHGTIGVVDAEWPEARLILELDGLQFHRTGQQRRADRARDRRLGLASHLVLRFTWSDGRSHPATLLAQVREGLAR